MRFIAYLFMLLALFVGQSAAAEPQASGPLTRTTADAAQSQVALLNWANFVRDEAGNKTVEDVVSMVRSGNSQRLDMEVFSRGFSSAAYWFVIPLENKHTFDLNRFLILNPSWLDDVRVTLIDAQGGTTTFLGGDTLPFSQRSEAYRRTNFALTLPPGESLLVVRTQTRDPYFVGIDLMERQAFHEFIGKETLYFGLLYGGLISLLLFNLMLFLSSREKTYLVYCAWLVAFIVMHATYNGHVFRWLLPESPTAHNWASSSFIYVYCVFGLVNALNILDLKAKLPIAYTWTWALIYALMLSFVMTAVLDGYRAHIVSSIAWVVVYAASAFILGLLSLQRHDSTAGYYMAASTAGLLGSTITALSAMKLPDRPSPRV